jgi:preprotein translocase subunit SecD
LSATRRDILILVVVVALLGAMAYFAFPLSKTNLGLDLQGGLSVILEVKQSDRAPEGVTASEMSAKIDQTVNVIQDRVNRLGVAEPEIRRQGQWQISVQLPGIKDQARALEIIGKTAVLEFFAVTDLGDSYATEAEALASAGVQTVDALPEGQELIYWPAAEDSGRTADEYYIVKTKALVTGSMLTKAGFDSQTPNGKYRVTMQFNDAGAKAFATMTKDLAEIGAASGTLQRLAIVLDGEVQSAPTVEDEIPGGNVEITGNFTLQEAKELALVLQTGQLPLNLDPISQNAIGATLGKTALNQALIAGAIGLLLIMVFMIAYYRLLGLVACIALVIYAVIFLGILNAIHATMTLPGIAGIILTLGMAVDANVLIFARMRDEVGAGKTIGAATSAGFKKAFRAVFDCNMTTVLTALVLFLTATGGIKGFALTLMIGVILSFLTAVAVTRSLLNLLSGWRPFRNPRLLGLHVPKARMTQTSAGGES